MAEHVISEYEFFVQSALANAEFANRAHTEITE